VAFFVVFPPSLQDARKKKNYMGPLLLLLLIVLCFVGLSFLAAKGAVPLKKSKMKEGHREPTQARRGTTQALHDVIFGRNDE
jgi:hypothetical protein